MPTPRPEHPRPHLLRSAWRSLNGIWSFARDDRADLDAAPPPHAAYDREIVVPFPPESRLSGIGDPSFHTSLWYRRTVRVPRGWEGHRLFLHVGACDHRAAVFVNEARLGEHVGGSAPFRIDLTDAVRPGEDHELVVHAVDDIRSGLQPGGKQSHQRASHGCWYARVSGIWQTVWLEAVHPLGLDALRVLPDLAGGQAVLVPTFLGHAPGTRLRCTARSGDRTTRREGPASSGVPLVVPLADPRPWTPHDPFLHGLELEVIDADGRTVDRVDSYVGLREVRVEGDQLLLNGEPRYLRMILDQGYWPDGIWTAPSDAALVRDIELARSAGFNGARLHQKAFEPRYHWHADRLGWLTWAEMPWWGIDENDPRAGRNLLSEWRELVIRDRDHPSILVWTPLNETEDQVVGPEHRRLVRDAAALTRALDPSRPVNDASGWVHQDTDLWTVHLYTQDPNELARTLAQDPPHRHRPDLERLRRVFARWPG
ncbi:MAG: glycoside hydrolase family 2 TIM barrel-domain containing protein [Trueperaceae bacterium]|nr:glycoside hydrolase family 2 TIM barrel-domain containing protein [Trueperaceae bacterium]